MAALLGSNLLHWREDTLTIKFLLRILPRKTVTYIGASSISVISSFYKIRVVGYGSHVSLIFTHTNTEFKQTEKEIYPSLVFEH